MKTEYTIQQVADAALLTRYQTEAWIARDHFKPENTVENGKARKFTFDDAVVLGVLAEFNRLGLSLSIVSMHSDQIRHRARRGSLFVIATIIRKVRATGEEIDGSQGHLINPADFERVIMNDPQVRAFAAINIEQIEERVRASLST